MISTYDTDNYSLFEIEDLQTINSMNTFSRQEPILDEELTSLYKETQQIFNLIQKTRQKRISILAFQNQVESLKILYTKTSDHIDSIVKEERAHLENYEIQLKTQESFQNGSIDSQVEDQYKQHTIEFFQNLKRFDSRRKQISKVFQSAMNSIKNTFSKQTKDQPESNTTEIFIKLLQIQFIQKNRQFVEQIKRKKQLNLQFNQRKLQKFQSMLATLRKGYINFWENKKEKSIKIYQKVNFTMDSYKKYLDKRSRMLLRFFQIQEQIQEKIRSITTGSHNDDPSLYEKSQNLSAQIQTIKKAIKNLTDKTDKCLSLEPTIDEIIEFSEQERIFPKSQKKEQGSDKIAKQGIKKKEENLKVLPSDKSTDEIKKQEKKQEKKQKVSPSNISTHRRKKTLSKDQSLVRKQQSSSPNTNKVSSVQPRKNETESFVSKKRKNKRFKTFDRGGGE